VFTAVYLAVFAAYGTAIGSDVAIPYVVLIVAVIVFVCRLDGRYDLGGGVLWGLSVWGLGHLAGGIVPLGGDRTLYNAVLPVELFHFDRLSTPSGSGSPRWPARGCWSASCLPSPGRSPSWPCSPASASGR